MKYRSITARWIVNTLCVVTAILIVIAASAVSAVRAYYYRTVKLTLNSGDNELLFSYFSLNTGSAKEGFATAARQFVEDFSEKDRMELWVIDAGGRIILSSSGFAVDPGEPKPDYNAALASSTGRGEWKGTTSSGEKIMAMSLIINLPGGQRAGAVRYLISLETVDRQIGLIGGVIVFVCLLAIFFVILSGLFFTRSIIRPIRNIRETAKRIAGGDFTARLLPYTYNDEIGELCETINYMADEIGTADRMKNDFLSTISHELRTPLTAIKGWGETLLQIGDSDPAMLERGMNVIIGEAGRLTGMVEELLDFSRMQSGKLNMRTEKIDVLAELDETIFAFKERSTREGIELNRNVSDAAAPMDADPDRIRQVFVNILDNAFKYTEQGGKVTVFAEVVASTLFVKITDTGCGISEEDLPRVKEKFYKSNTSAAGSGIGLAVADEIVRLHKGELSIDSVLGKGTTVLISLPVAQTSAEEKGNQNEQG